jgi:PAS domain S-box-containing protein
MSDETGAMGDGGAPSADIQCRIAMDLSPIGFCLVATDGTFLRVNNALCELMGRDEQALKAATWQELTHPEDLEADQRLVDEVLAGHCDGYRIVKRYLRPDGSIVWGDLAVGCMRNTDGTVRYFISQIVDVTTMHDAHEALASAQEQTREQAEYLRAVIDSELDPRVLVTPHRDASGTVVDLMYSEANARALTYFGRSADEIIGARMLQLYPAQRTSGLFDGYLHTLQTGDPLIVNERELTSDVSGEVRWIDLQAVRVDDTLSITWRDVSDRRRASEALAASEAHYRVLAQYSSDIVTECDHDGVFTWVSDSVTDRLGWSPSELVGRPIRRFVHRDDHVAVDQFASDLRDGEKRQLTARILTRDGDYRWFTVMVQPQLDADGHVVGRVSGWRYVHAEHEAQAEVQRSRTLYQLIAENAADVVLLMDSDGQITWLSPSIERLSGWPAEALTGNQAWRLAHPDDADKIRAVVAEVLESSGRAHVEARLRTRHGDYRWWHIAMRRTSTDIDAALVAALRDVNDEVVARKRAESESAKRIALLNSMFDPHVVLEAVRDETGDIVDFIYTDANDAACEYNRTGREELVGASLMQLLPGHRGSDLFAAYCHTVDTGEPLVLDDYVYPNEILTEPRHYDIRAVKVADSLSYTWRDVTDRSLLGEQLAESEERFRLIATNTSDIIGVADTHGTLEWVSPSITRALGWDPADMKGHGVYELVHPNDMARVLQGQSEVADGREGSVRARVRTGTASITGRRCAPHPSSANRARFWESPPR